MKFLFIIIIKIVTIFDIDFKKYRIQERGHHSYIFKSKMTSLISNVHVVLTTVKARNILSLPKPKFNIVTSFKVIYQYTCPKCQSEYIGRKKRIMFHRISEHMNGFVGRHHKACNDNNNNISECFQILDSARHYKDLCILEALYIKKRKPSLNKQLMNNGAEHILSFNIF